MDLTIVYNYNIDSKIRKNTNSIFPLMGTITNCRVFTPFPMVP
jgi:hypothetical protein